MLQKLFEIIPQVILQRKNSAKKIEAVSTEEGLEMWSRLLKVAAGEPRPRSTEKVALTAEVLKDTADRLNDISEVTGKSVGEQIDRLCFNFHPYDAGLAAHMISRTESKNKRMLFTTLLTQGKLYQHCAEVEKQARDMFFRLVKQIAESEGVTEKLKADNQMEWVARINNIRCRATEIVNHDIIYT